MKIPGTPPSPKQPAHWPVAKQAELFFPAGDPHPKPDLTKPRRRKASKAARKARRGNR